MIQEQADRLTVGWSRERLARVSGVGIAAIYLLERMGTAGPEDDARIRSGLAQGKAKHGQHNARPYGIDLGPAQNANERLIRA